MAELAGRVSRRASAPADEPFLTEVFAGTREDELALLAAAPELQADFAGSQSRLQQRVYAETYPGGAFEVVLLDGAPVGRLFVGRGDDEICLVDIALLPRHRGAGIGTHLLRELQAEAAATGATISLHVGVRSQAQRLYRRLGFVVTAATEVHLRMRWTPPEPQPNTAS
ncbi:MAG: hypothetical protein QOF77_843 [Solirubrobacteraceae bacterium]|nr:hypothetical protein [Solirubrobacteraceae bacterium]